MTELLTAAQMRAIEQAAIASGEVTGLELMERAGRGVVEAIFEEWPELRAGSYRAVVLCGPGNNGGDGFVVARLLKEWGWEVEVFLYGDPARLPPDARVNYQRWRGMGEVGQLGFPKLSRRGLEALSKLWGYDHHVELLVDAVFGAGLSRAADQLGPLFDSSEYLTGNISTRVVAIDVPTGLCSDSGRLFPPGPLQMTPNPVIQADLAVTFQRAKVGHNLDRAPLWCERIAVADIGLDKPGLPAPLCEEGVILLPDAVNWQSVVSLISLGKSTGHKYAHGHALILSGPSGHGGAARLAARGALRIGAGLVTVGCPPEALTENAARLDAVMLREVAGDEDLRNLLSDQRINALCLGPGLGADRADLLAAALGWNLPDGLPLIDADQAQVAAHLNRHGHRPAVVLDADALTILSRNPDLFAALHDRCVLTPHAGEFARLFPDIAATLAEPAMKGPAYSKVDATREAAKRAGCVVLYKGPDTVIADPSGRCSINSAHYDRAAPWLATAGSGDVLSGFIAGLLARGFAPMQAAETAAWLHVECARHFGPGLIAEDLPEQLPAVFRSLGL
ncbi:NAD(P)H-hydrate dehydratase [Albidovulum sp.]|jgi:hydroxyethylthiazole kinase-like uncharacterized protein yjeF|uniref:NAD(P)H-hydrate dehydratase n=1 Tax=Albidovulum sp. TaxID=1872424 RepID=UPI00305FD248